MILKRKLIRNGTDDFYVVFIEEYENGFEATKEAYRKLVEKYPEDWSVLFSVANTFSHHEEYEEAIRYWQMTFDCMLKPRYTDPYAAMALCCIRMGDKKQAAGYYKKQIELLRTDWNTKYSAEIDRLQDKIEQLQA